MSSGVGMFAFLAAYVLVAIVVGGIVYVVTSFFYMKIFQKAGVQDAWRAWVPVYNFMIFLKLGDLSPWLALYAYGGLILLAWIGIGSLFGVAMAVLGALAAWRIGMKLGKEPVWVVLYVFLAPIWLGINAFDSSRWNTAVPRAPWAANSFFGDRTVWAGIPTQGGWVVPQGYAPPAPQGYAPPAPQDYVPPAAPPAPPTPPAPPASEGDVPPAPPAV